MNFKEVVEDADHVIVITVHGNGVALSFSDGLDEMQVLDYLSFATAAMYETAEEGTSRPRKH